VSGACMMQPFYRRTLIIPSISMLSYGSARVSSDDHNPALYLSALPKAGCTTIGTEAGLAGTTVQRPPLPRSLKTLCAGNTRMLSTCDP